MAGRERGGGRQSLCRQRWLLKPAFVRGRRLRLLVHSRVLVLRLLVQHAGRAGTSGRRFWNADVLLRCVRPLPGELSSRGVNRMSCGFSSLASDAPWKKPLLPRNSVPPLPHILYGDARGGVVQNRNKERNRRIGRTSLNNRSIWRWGQNNPATGGSYLLRQGYVFHPV